MKKVISIIVCIPIFLLSGCDKDLSLSPSGSSGKLTLKVYSSPEIKVLPLNVMYRSDKCKQKRSNAKGEFYEVPGFNLIKIPLESNTKNGVHSSTVSFDGGGECLWKLSNITYRIVYDSSFFGKDLTNSVGTSIVMVFDHNSPQISNGNFDVLIGAKQTIKKEYYPWVSESFIGGHSKAIWLYGNGVLSSYKFQGAKEIVFDIVSHTKKITYSTGPAVKGGDVRFVYPDGTTSSGGDFPDLERIKKI